jgi:hypothetical protein
MPQSLPASEFQAAQIGLQTQRHDPHERHPDKTASREETRHAQPKLAVPHDATPSAVDGFSRFEPLPGHSIHPASRPSEGAPGRGPTNGFINRQHEIAAWTPHLEPSERM